jgi:DNA-binding MarR family transcriptional regulator
MTESQQQVLSALAALCPGSGQDVDARTVAERAEMRLGSVVVVLRSLEKRRLVLVHDGEPEAWAPTMSGRARVRHIRSGQPSDKPPPAA